MDCSPFLFRCFASTLLSLLPFTLHAQTAPPDGGDFSHNLNAAKVPVDVILVKGAWASSSDSSTPVPEAGSLAEGVYTNKYFSLAYTLPPRWTQDFSGPPPSDAGFYVLAELKPPSAADVSPGSLLISAQDLFFTLAPASSAVQLVDFMRTHLAADYQVERSAAPVTIADHTFLRFDYFSPSAELHWSVLATQIRCHVVEFVLTGRDPKWMEQALASLDTLNLPSEASPLAGTGGGDVPICIPDYARPENLTDRIDPVFTERRFNPVPVRITIDKDGRVKHIHFLSAFPDQSKAISDALWQWRFKPFLRGGKPVEVETGILFGNSLRPVSQSVKVAVSE